MVRRGWFNGTRASTSTKASIVAWGSFRPRIVRHLQTVMPPLYLADVSNKSFFSSLLGGRIGAVVPEASVSLGSLANLDNLNFGLSLYGAIGGGALALALFGWRRSLLTLSLVDAFSLYLPLGIGLFHLGCLMYGFCGGKPAPLPLGIPLPGHAGLRYPSERYEGILALGLFFALLRFSRRGLSPGAVTGLFLFVYPLIRALVNLTRVSTGPWPWADQVVSLSFATVGLTILLLVWSRRRNWPTVGKTSRDSERNVPLERSNRTGAIGRH